MDLERVIEHYHGVVLDEFARGNPEPAKALYSRRDDVTLANPFGPAVRGWERVWRALDFASSRFRDGDVASVEVLALYASSALASLLAIEEWRAKVGGRTEIAPFTLRVTSTLRLEDGTWKLVHRHADPITTADPEGPLRAELA